MKLLLWIAVVVMSLSAAVGQTAEECSKDALPAASVEQLDMYDKDLYLEPDCVDPDTPLPMHCNYMGLGQECRGCFLTCSGARNYTVDFFDEYAIWGDAIVSFCPGAEADSLDDC